jgi:spermidine/putrescine transport system permease protein
VFITALVVVPMAFILVYSFYENIDLAQDVPAFQFGNWQELLTDSYYRTAIWKTLRLSLIVTVLAAVLGYIPAYVIAMTRYRHKWLLLLLLIIPFWISFIIRTLSWIHIFGNQGALNGLLRLLGLTDAPLSMMYTEFTVIVGFIHVFLPYMILNIYVSLEGIDQNLEPAARTLGATPWQAFKEVTLPLSVPGLAAGCLLVFVLTGGSYVTPLILGGPSDFLFGNLVYDAVVTELNWPMGATLSFALLLFLGSVVVLYSKLMGMDQLSKAFGR